MSTNLVVYKLYATINFRAIGAGSEERGVCHTVCYTVNWYVAIRLKVRLEMALFQRLLSKEDS